MVLPRRHICQYRCIKCATPSAAYWQTVTAVSHRIPVEVLVYILRMIPTYRESWKQRLDGRSSVMKGGLAKAGLTCRYWAEQIRPLLFGELLLRGPEDVAQLIQLVKSPPVMGSESALSTYIREITYLKVTNAVPPWTRLQMLSKLLPSGIKISIDTGFRIEQAQLDGSSFVHCLPRTLPPSAFPPLEEIRLRNVKFRNNADVLRLTATFPRLNQYTSSLLDIQSITPAREDHLLAQPLRRIQCAELWHHPVPIPRHDDAYRNFEVRLRRALRAVSAQQALDVGQQHWEHCLGSLVRLIPKRRSVGVICVDKHGQSNNYRTCSGY